MPNFVNWFQKEASGLLGSTLEDEGTTFLQNIRKHIPQNLNPQQHHCGNLNLTQLQNIIKLVLFVEAHQLVHHAIHCRTQYEHTFNTAIDKQTSIMGKHTPIFIHMEHILISVHDNASSLETISGQVQNYAKEIVFSFIQVPLRYLFTL
jgi:hypothetical protein